MQNTKHIVNVKQLESVTVGVTVNVLIVEIPNINTDSLIFLF
ncbi:MAG TPA: hypothetical protein VEJ68_01690 [Candidatus Bathyarchaeia archaeon]|nr:hypothetical protein [Candidatus Bathyarchaeia archaeon]